MITIVFVREFIIMIKVLHLGNEVYTLSEGNLFILTRIVEDNLMHKILFVFYIWFKDGEETLAQPLCLVFGVLYSAVNKFFFGHL